MDMLYSAIGGYVLISFFCVIVLVFIYWADRRWYKRHPGAEEKFAQIDEELTRKGQ